MKPSRKRETGQSAYTVPPDEVSAILDYFNPLGSPVELSLMDNRPWGADENGFRALGEILNWTDTQAEGAKLMAERVADDWEGTPEHARLAREAMACGQAVAILRGLGASLLAHPAERTGYVRPEYVFGALDLSVGDLGVLSSVANQRPLTYDILVCRGWPKDDHGEPTITHVDVGVSYALGGHPRIIWATRALWPILRGEVTISRCAADLRGKPCSGVVVNAVGGQQRLYCSDKCHNRMQQRRREPGPGAGSVLRGELR